MNKFVTLTANVMYVNNVLLVITYGQGIGLITAKFMPNWTAYQLACNLKKLLIYILELDLLSRLF